jgi:hypothetical protein
MHDIYVPYLMKFQQKFKNNPDWTIDYKITSWSEKQVNIIT